MRIVRRLAQLDDQIFFLGRVIVTTARGYSVEANPKYIRDLIAVLGLEGLDTCGDFKCQDNTNDRVAGRTGERKTGRVQDSRCARSAQASCTTSRKTARKILCPTESDEIWWFCIAEPQLHRNPSQKHMVF